MSQITLKKDSVNVSIFSCFNHFECYKCVQNYLPISKFSHDDQNNTKILRV